MDAATKAGIPVVIVQQTAAETWPIFARGRHGFALHATVAGRPNDHRLEKALPSCFAGTDLAEWLGGRAIDTVVICGYMTQNCDESTARDAAHRGLGVVFLSHATGTLDMANHTGALTAEGLRDAVLLVLQSRFASVLTTDQWLDAVAHGTPVPKRDIFASTQTAHDAARAARRRQPEKR